MKHFAPYLIALLLLGACSETKYVPDGKYLLNKVSVNDDEHHRDVNTTLLKSYVRQRSNSRWFSTVKLPLVTYSLSGRDSSKWVNRFLKSIGEEPVIFDSVQAQLSCFDLRQELQNEGYLKAEVELQTRKHGKKVDVEYLLKPGEPYFVHEVDYQVDDSIIRQLLQLDNPLNFQLRAGRKFTVNDLDAERKRITQILNDSGYYRFHKEFITFVADTAHGSRLVNILLKLSKYRREEMPDTLHKRYHMKSVTYASGAADDSVIHLRPSVLRECNHIEPGSFYSANNLRRTYNHFGRMGAIRYTNITFTEHPDTALLDCNISLQTNKPSTLSFQPEGTNTAGDLGAAASLTYQNRNLFRGSENLSVELRGAYEAIRGLEGYRNQDFIEYSVETRLTFPRFIAPFLSRDVRRNVNATSEVSLLYDLQDRPEFHRRVLSGAWRYKWNLPKAHSQFQFDMIDLNYVFMPWISETFHREYLENEDSRNAILRYNYEDLFITKFGVGYAFNDGRTAMKVNLESSGNLLSSCASLLGGKKDEQGQYRLFNIAFAQYVKGDFDYTRILPFDSHNQLVFHLGLGIAYPYGNSTVLPFEKRYFSGGANSVRGWSVRSLGPGKFKGNDGRIDFINQTGDMKLDLNVEYRTHLFWKLGGALFIDAGNIWTLRDYEEQPGGQFSFSDLPAQLAVGYGMGFRFNFDYFIVRFDLGMKAVNPAYETDNEEHYPLLHPRLSRDFAFHFAVGLPF